MALRPARRRKADFLFCQSDSDSIGTCTRVKTVASAAYEKIVNSKVWRASSWDEDERMRDKREEYWAYGFSTILILQDYRIGTLWFILLL